MPYDPINILWIEDNPMQGGITGSVINEREPAPVFPPKLDNTVVPAIFFENNPELFQYFRLQVLQHPEEIKEFISTCLEIEDRKGMRALGKTEGAVPELVIFDYRLKENIEINRSIHSMKYKDQIKPIREYVNPLFKIYAAHPDLFDGRAPYFENVGRRSYLAEDFIRNINLNPSLTSRDDTMLKDMKELDNDQLGLFAGVEVSRMFRNHACVAVPATFNNADVSKMHVLSKFYEWMNGYDLGTMFGAEQRRDKKWDIIIPHAVKQLRIRILAHVRTGKLTVSYAQLRELSSGVADESENVFSFASDYVQKNLPIDGLFMDVPADSRAEAVKAWAGELIEALPRSDADIARAIEVSDKLWSVFLEKFGERIDLSNLAYWGSVPANKLTEDEKQKLAKFKSGFGVDTTSIQELFPKAKNQVNPTIRLAVLHLATRAAIEMNKCKNNAPNKNIYKELEPQEYFNLLFPRVLLNDDLILPMHKDNDTDAYNLMENGRKWLYRKLGVAEREWSSFESWITFAERQLLKSLFFSEDAHFPNWLKY